MTGTSPGKFQENLLSGFRGECDNLIAIRKGILEKDKCPSPPTPPELSFLLAILHLILFYISTKYHKNIPKGIQLTE